MAEAMVIPLFVYHRLDLANAAVAGQDVYKRQIDELLAATAGDIKVRVRPFVLTDKFTEGKLYIEDRPVLDIQVLEVLGRCV